MKKILNISLFVSAMLVVNGCVDSEDEIRTELLSHVTTGEEVQISSGSADFSKYVAIGNSITAGLMDAALYTNGQNNSYPNLLANQMLPAGGGAFNQPDINSVDGFNISLPQPGSPIFGRLVLNVGAGAPEPKLTGDLPSAYTGDKSALNNFAVPGARVVDMVTPAYVANPLYARFASNPVGLPSGSSILTDAATANGSFITYWMGQNDLLGYLLSGGTSDDVTDNPAAILNPSSLTDVTNFIGALGAVVATLSGGGTKDGAIANLVDATFTPFFRAVPYNSIPLDQATADLLMLGPSGTGADGFAGFNAGLDQLVGLNAITAADAASRKISFAAGVNAVLIEDDNLLDISVFNPALAGKGQMRQIKPGELLLLTSATVLNTSPAGFPPTALYGISVPLPDQYSLTADELALHQSRLTAFNDVIAAQAAAFNLALVDTYSLFGGIALGGGFVTDAGVKLDPDFLPNGIYSVDGIHPNPRGQAIVANAFIAAINAKYGSNLQDVDVLNQPGVTLK
ncbi:MAG: hypothetical protein JXQ96_19500 [Cyclobacteriaceae bacterium]